jgi:hypothetical protein
MLKQNGFILFFSLVFSVSVSAGITPVIVSSDFDNDTWYPLPVEQMENAAVDMALTRISESGSFAFLYETGKTIPTNPGSLHLKVSLIEPAETAKIVIRLSLPDNNGTYVSTSSVSLSSKDYQGIYRALELLGADAADQLTASMELASTTLAVDKNEQAIRDQIVKLNVNVIKLDNTIGMLQQNSHNNEIMQKLGKLDVLVNKIEKHHEYVKRSDIDKNRKLDAIYDEIKNLNVGANTDNRPPEGSELSDYDISLLPELNRASELKFDKQFKQAKAILVDVVTDPKISPVFRKAVTEEMHINLPLYEAEIIINETSSMFMRYLKNDEYRSKLKYAGYLYDSVLIQPELSFKKRMEIRQKKDQLNLTSDSMSSAATAFKANSLDMLTRSLQNEYAKHNTERAMGFKSAKGPCPSLKKVDTAMKKSSIDAPVFAYNTSENRCELVLEESSEHLLVFVFSDEIPAYNRKKR